MRPLSNTEKAYKVIKEMIVSFELQQGFQVVEEDISTKLHMSRTPVREAIRKLASENLIELVPRKGTFVKRFSLIDLVKIYEIAMGLEGTVSFLVTEKLVKGKLEASGIKELKHHCENMNKFELENSIHKWIESDEAFHKTLYRLCDNMYIFDDCSKLRTQLNVTLSNTIPTYLDMKSSNNEHQKLLAAIEKGDADEARMIMQKQHQRVRDTILKNSSLFNNKIYR